MSGLGAALQQRLGGLPVASQAPRKRRRSQQSQSHAQPHAQPHPHAQGQPRQHSSVEEEEEEELEDGGAARARRRPRIDAAVQAEAEAEAEAEDDEATEDQGTAIVVHDGASVFTSLEESHARAMHAAMARERASRRRVCLLCERGNMAFDTTSSEGCMALAEMNNWYVSYYQPFREYECAREMLHIYERNVAEPARRLNGGVLPPSVHALTLDELVVHIKYHNPSLLAGNVWSLTRMRMIAEILTEKIEVEGVPDNRTAETAMRAVMNYNQLNTAYAKDLGRGVEVQLDPSKVLAMTHLGRLEALQTRQTSALGGATGATETAVARPSFGAAATANGVALFGYALPPNSNSIDNNSSSSSHADDG